MKGLFLSCLLVLFICRHANAQSDTIYHYFSKEYKEVNKDSAFSFIKISRDEKGWFGKEYFFKNNVLKSEGYYTSKDAKSPDGTFKNYNEKGALENITEWNNGKAVSRSYYYKNGNKKSWVSYNDKGVDQQKGWDEAGKEIRHFVTEKEASFKCGMEGWKKYLEKHLNANVAADAGAPIGMYEVKVQFLVTPEGFVSNVKAVSIPAKCKPCASEAVNVLSNSPEWEPAILNNEPVKYQAIQFVQFMVAEEVKKGKKG